MRSDVTKPRRPQQRIAKSMRQHISIRMSHRPLVERQLDPANNKFPAPFKPVQVVTDSRLGCRSPSSLDSPGAALDPPFKEKTEPDEKNEWRCHENNQCPIATPPFADIYARSTVSQPPREIRQFGGRNGCLHILLRTSQEGINLRRSWFQVDVHGKDVVIVDQLLELGICETSGRILIR